MLTVVDLFSGAGGLSLGFERAGFQTIFAVDNNLAAVETFRHNLGGTVSCADLAAGISIPRRPTVIVGGPPCQGFSSAGMRRTSDERNTLVAVFAQIVARTRPEAFVFENVEGFLTSARGRRVFDLLQPLLEAGYQIHLRKVNAANFGIPQHRKRVLAIGGLGFKPTFPEPSHSAFGAPGSQLAGSHLPPTKTVAETIGQLPSPANRPPGNPTDHYCGQLSGDRLRVVSALRPGQTMKDLPDRYWHQSYRRRAFRRVKDGTPSAKRGGPPAGLRRLRSDEPGKAITGGCSSEFVHPIENRLLTLRECARLQTFPDDFVFCGTKAERALLIGNAVPPLLARVVAQQLARDLQNKRCLSGGTLLSFVPALSNGVSPALRYVTDLVSSRYQLSASQSNLF